MSRYGPQFGPDITFLGVDRCDWAEPATYHDADVVILGAPFDGGTSHRPGTRFGPQFIRQTCYLPHDGSRPSLALRVDALRDLRVYDAGDVEMFSGDSARSVRDLQTAVHAVASSGAIPLILGGDHTIAWPDAAGVAQHVGEGRVSMVHFDAHADTGNIEFGSLIGHGQPMRRLIESGAVRGDRFLQIGLRGYWPPPETLDWMAEQRMRSYEMSEIGTRGLDALPDRGVRHRSGRLRRRLLVGRHRRVRPGACARHRHTGARRSVGAAVARLGTAGLLRTAGRRHRRGRGVAAVRPRGHHLVPRQSRCSGGVVGHCPAAARRGRGDGLGSGAATVRRPLTRAPLRARQRPPPGLVWATALRPLRSTAATRLNRRRGSACHG